ncbi:TPA: malonate decarboxylase holo-ACP synthase [Serratia marcescens]
MATTVRPHDLLWLRRARLTVQEDWVRQYWHIDLPLVVRRDMMAASGLIPIGVRGKRREQRAAGWVRQADIASVIAPEMLICRELVLRSPFVTYPPLRALLALSEITWPWRWGVTGSTGYALATNLPVLHANSDLDLLIRIPKPLPREVFLHWQESTSALPCRIDTQIETPLGAFALNEWLCKACVLLKTNSGPLLTTSPWDTEVR